VAKDGRQSATANVAAARFILAAHFWHIRDFSFMGNSKSSGWWNVSRTVEQACAVTAGVSEVTALKIYGADRLSWRSK